MQEFPEVYIFGLPPRRVALSVRERLSETFVSNRERQPSSS